MAGNNRKIFYLPTGGTMCSKKERSGRHPSFDIAKKQVSLLAKKVPHTDVEFVDCGICQDSSALARRTEVAGILSDNSIKLSQEGHGQVIGHGTDTMNITAPILAMMGCEVYRYPVTLAVSMKGFDKPNTDAVINLIMAGFFSAYGNSSGVHVVRPHGHIITYRHDTPLGSIDMHERGIPQAPHSYFAKIDIEQLLSYDQEWVSERRRTTFLEGLISYAREQYDGTLDTLDQIVSGGRGFLPNFSMLGYGKQNIIEFVRRPKDDTPENIKADILNLIGRMKQEGKAVNELLHVFGLIQVIKRQWGQRKSIITEKYLSQNWADVLQSYLAENLGFEEQISKSMVNFWSTHSYGKNGEMNFEDIVIEDVKSDPKYLFNVAKHTLPKAVILKATGNGGMRFRPDAEEDFYPWLSLLKEEGVPVVLTTRSRGEVTSFEYGPARQSFNYDLAFYGGTLDEDLVLPRLAILNTKSIRNFRRDLMSIIEVDPAQEREITRNIDRQLLSGSHYSYAQEGEFSDRMRIEHRYGIETRLDFLSNVNVYKAVFAAWLNEITKRQIPISPAIVNVLGKY